MAGPTSRRGEATLIFTPLLQFHFRKVYKLSAPKSTNGATFIAFFLAYLAFFENFSFPGKSARERDREAVSDLKL